MNTVQITSTAFGSKFQSKRECYTFLTLDVKAYLPDYKAVTVYFLKDLVSGEKKFIKQKNIQHLQIPQ